MSIDLSLPEVTHASDSMADIWAKPNATAIERYAWTAVLKAQVELGYLPDDEVTQEAIRRGEACAAMESEHLQQGSTPMGYSYGVLRRLAAFMLDTGCAKYHIGMSSSDLINLRHAVQSAQAAKQLASTCRLLASDLADWAAAYKESYVPVMGKTHGESAQQIPYSRRVVRAYLPAAISFADLLSDPERTVRWGGLSGATGNSRDITVLGRLQGTGRIDTKGLSTITADTLGIQHPNYMETHSVYPQDGCHRSDMELALRAKAAGAYIVSCAEQARLWLLLGEVKVRPAVGDRSGSSSSMPHKQSGWEWERLRSLGLMLQGESDKIMASLSPSSWLEGDVSSHAVRHSSIPMIWMTLDSAAALLADLIRRTEHRPIGAKSDSADWSSLYTTINASYPQMRWDEVRDVSTHEADRWSIDNPDVVTASDTQLRIDHDKCLFAMRAADQRLDRLHIDIRPVVGHVLAVVRGPRP